MNLNKIKLIKLSEFENNNLKRVKKQRSIGEYCWTLTPFSFKFVFDLIPDLERLTYVDADLYFLKNPRPIFEEFENSGKNVLITEHAFDAEYDQSFETGKYCVQFIIFKRFNTDYILKWWQEKCLEECSADQSNGLFGDQKYLDLWPNLFINDVHILEKKFFFLAPWNCFRFPYSEAIAFHFHNLRIISYDLVELGSYPIPKTVINNVYRPYLSILKDIVFSLERLNFKVTAQSQRTFILKRVYRKFKKLILKLNQLFFTSSLDW